MNIKLTQNKEGVIDKEKYSLISKYKWYAVKSAKTYYAYTHPKKDENPIAMHRLLLNPPKDKVIDHIDGDGLNNTLKNLRVCSHSQNKMNMENYINNSSGFRGVIFDKSRNKWLAKIKNNNKFINLGRFDKKEDAIKAYEKKGKEIYGDFLKLKINYRRIKNNEIQNKR